MEHDAIYHWNMYPEPDLDSFMVDEEWDQEVEDYISDLAKEYGE